MATDAAYAYIEYWGASGTGNGLSGFTFDSSFEWLDDPNDGIKQFGYIETPRRQYTAPHITQRMQEPFRGNKFRLGGQKT